MGMRIDTILKRFSNGSQSAASEEQADPDTTLRGRRPNYIENMPPGERAQAIAKAHITLRGGLTVFMSRPTVLAFQKLLETKITSRLMRRVLEEVANGRLILTTPSSLNKQSTAPLYKEPLAPPVRHPLEAGVPTMPMVMSVDQLSAGMPFTLRQAAKILNVSPQQLRTRCLMGRIHHEKERSRYYIPAGEVQRLQVIGLQ